MVYCDLYSGSHQPGSRPRGASGAKKSSEEAIVGRCDSFVVETNVHFPTDINLLLDAIRKVIEISAELAEASNLPGWRQYRYHYRQLKKKYRKVQRLKHSTSKDEGKQQLKEQEIQEAHRAYLELAESHLQQAELTRQQINADDPVCMAKLCLLDEFIADGHRQNDQIERRVLQGE